MTRDLIREEFAGDVKVEQVCEEVRLKFPTIADANRAAFVIKNALELGLPIQIRTR